MKLDANLRAKILVSLCEGVSIRATARMQGVSTTTVLKLIADAGAMCLDLHDELVQGLRSERVECDEVWSFIHTREGNKANAKTSDPERGDIWTWTCVDSDSKLVVSYLVGQRSQVSGETFLRDVAARIVTRTQITTDGFPFYVRAIQKIFGHNVDHGVLVKVYANVPTTTRYAPLEVVGTKREAVTGVPDMSRASTSIAERVNLHLRMSQRRYTRLTNGHSKKYANHLFSLAIYLMFYNFIRPHQSLGGATPAMRAGIAEKPMTFMDILQRMDAVAPKPGPKGPRRRRADPE
jgi:IS1 family transposase